MYKNDTALHLLAQNYNNEKSRKSLKIMLDYSEKLGINTTAINENGRTPFQDIFCEWPGNVSIADIDLWMDQPVEFNGKAFKFMHLDKCLTIINYHHQRNL